MVAGSSDPRSPRRGIVALLSLGVSLGLTLGGFLALASSARETAPTHAPIHDPLADAKIAVVDGDFASAEKILRTIYGNEAKTLLGRVALELGHPDEASQLFGEVLKEDSKNLEATRGLAIAPERLGRLDLAILYWTRATELRKGDAHLWRGLALCQREKGDAMGALSSLQQSLSLDSHQMDLSNLLTELATQKPEIGHPGLGAPQSPGMDRLHPRAPDPFSVVPQPRVPDPLQNLPTSRSGIIRK